MSSIRKPLSLVADGVRKIWMLIGATIFFVILFESCALLLFAVLDSISDPHVGWCDRIMKADAYVGADWTSDYCEVNENLAMEWHSYTYWGRMPSKSTHININERGMRKTWNRPAEECGPDPTRIFVFGGSTIFGPAARDAYTVPSQISKRIAETEFCVEILNLGETGYVSTQELIRLILRLQEGDVPDVVVFYDGVNELFSAFQNNEAGLPQNEDHRRKEFNFLRDRARVRNAYFNQLFRPEGLTRLQAAVQARLRPDAAGGAGLVPEQSGVVAEPRNQDELITEMLHVYKSNLELVRSLAEHYEFDAIFYWHPLIFTKKTVSAYEQNWVDLAAGQWRDFLMTAYARVEQDEELESAEDFHNFARIFDDLPDPYYVDAFHLTEDGNGIIGQAIAEDLIKRLRESASNPS